MKPNSIVERLARYLRQVRGFCHEEEGAVLVEMTLVTPFVLLLSAGVFEFSNLLHTRLLLEAGVEDAARYIARCNDPQATCESDAQNLAVNGAITGGTARVAGWLPADVTFSYTTTTVTIDAATGLTNYRSQSPNVTVVSVSTSFSPSTTGLWSFLGFDAPTLTVSHQERVIGW